MNNQVNQTQISLYSKNLHWFKAKITRIINNRNILKQQERAYQDDNSLFDS